MGKSKFQKFIENLTLSFLSVIKVLALSKLNSKKLNSQENNHCIILGNGPSLKGSIEENINKLVDSDLFVVNFFWKSEYFEKLKPNHYMIISTNYWTEGKIDFNDEGRKKTFHEIVKRTQWKMELYVPYVAKKDKNWKKLIDSNKNIHVNYLNITPVEGFKGLMFWFFKKNLGMPRPHNVLIPSIKAAIEKGYKEIELLGADHSWLKELYVADDNTVYLSQKHFYDQQKVKEEVMYKGTTNEVRNLSEVLMKIVHSLNGYYILDTYAKKNKSMVINRTPNSYIDAFERKKV